MDMVDHPRDESGVTPIVSAQGGVDAVTRGTSGLAGVGVLGGMLVGHLGVGMQVGARVAIASF